MIVFDLHCDEGHVFEGWFGSSEDFASQKERGLVSCPECGSMVVGKAPMAPAVPRKGNQIASSEDRRSDDRVDNRKAPMTGGEIPAEVRKAIHRDIVEGARSLREKLAP